MPSDNDKVADRIASGCTWVYVAVVILLAVICLICIVAFSIWLNA
jgi:hypothetical protein